MTDKFKEIICRICLRSDSKIKKKCMSLFEMYKNGLISDIINSIANVGIQKDDGLPSKICPDCLLELDTAFNFKTKCENSNNVLRLNEENKLKSERLDCSEATELDVENIKKEEPVEENLVEDYGDVDFLNEDLFLESQFGLKTDTQDVLLDELKESRKSRVVDLKLECHDCGGLFKSKCKLKVHWQKVHMLEKLICQMCKRAFKSFKAYNRHTSSNNNPCMIATQVNVEGMGKNRVFHCKDCNYHSRRIKDIQSHLYTHTGDRPYVCNICQKSFTQQSSLQNHQEVSHKMYKMEVTCQFCGKYLKGRGKVYRHLKLHRENTGVQCDICKKMLCSKKSLILHMRRHTGIKMFTCELCASSYYTLSELCNHRRMKHEKGKHIYKCDICGYNSFRSETLKKHKKRHTSTNICCLVCGFFVPSAEALVQHQKRHFKKFPCSYCDLKYARKDSLHKHIKAKHKFTFTSLASKPLVVKMETPSVRIGDDNMIEVEVNTIGTKFTVK